MAFAILYFHGYQFQALYMGFEKWNQFLLYLQNCIMAVNQWSNSTWPKNFASCCFLSTAFDKHNKWPFNQPSQCLLFVQ